MKTITKTLPIGTDASGEGFEASVLEAARQQAELILEASRQESEATFQALVSQQKGDPIAIHKSETKAALRRKIASARQANQKKLLEYRKQLVNGLFAEAEEDLEAFTASPAYAEFLQKTLGAHAEAAKGGCTVRLRKADEAHKAALAKLLPAAVFETDATIHLGGGKVLCGRILYDETLDERLREQHDAFLTRCGLHVNPQQEPNHEA